MKTVSEESASAAELETPHSMDEAMETGFLPDDEHYRLTGEFKPETTDASAAATKKENESEKADASAASGDEKDESENDDASAASSSKAAASETAQSQTGRVKENRWQRRERELREARAEIAKLKAQSSQPERRSETAQATTQPATETTTAKAAPKPKIDDLDAKTGKPKYKNYAEYEDAKDQWLIDEGGRRQQESSAKSAQLTAQQQAEREIGQSLTKKFEPLRAKYADFDKVALNDIDPATGKLKYPDSPSLFIPAKSVTDDFIVRSPHGGEVLYYLGQHPEITQGFYGRNQAGVPINLIHPLDQTRKLMEIEAQFYGTASSGKSGDDKSSSSSAKPVTQASRPPHQVSGQGTVAKDAVEQALDDGDFETYQRTQNAKELARLKRK